MPKKKPEEKISEKSKDKGKKGGESQRKKDQDSHNDALEYIEIDEFTLDDLPGQEEK